MCALVKLIKKCSCKMISIRNYASNKPLSKDTFLTGDSVSYIEEMYKAWLQDPNSVHKSWDVYFKYLGKGIVYESPPLRLELNRNEVPLVEYFRKVKHSVPGAAQEIRTATTSATATATVASKVEKPSSSPAPTASVVQITKEIKVALAARQLIRSYQEVGFINAKLDPLNLGLTPLKTSSIPDALKKPNDLNGNDDVKVDLGTDTFVGGSEKSLSVKDLENRLKTVYSDTLGIEYTHNLNSKQVQWLKEKVEVPEAFKASKEEKKLLCKRLLHAGTFETFLRINWPKEMLLSIDGCDAAIPMIQSIIDRGSENGVDTFVIGSYCRGRVNLMANVMKKKLRHIFAHFFDFKPEDGVTNGDLIHNLGATTERELQTTKKKVKLIFLSGPSHAGIYYPMTVGRTRSEQKLKKDDEGKKVMAIIVHGDASLSGNSICYEAVQLSELKNFGCKGIIHVVLSNQIASFTALPQYTRSSTFSTDAISKLLSAPVIHLNSEDPNKIPSIAKIAVDWRTKFGKDFVIDVIGYRRYGDHDFDNPKISNPDMYKKIEGMQPIWQKYVKESLKKGDITDVEVKKLAGEYATLCENELEAAKKEKKIKFSEFVDSPLLKKESKGDVKIGETGLKEDVLKYIGDKFSSPPPADLKFALHKNIDRTLKGRRELLEKRQMDWSLGEAFAWGSLLKEGVPGRLSGQDSQRGTFSHRHHMIHNQNDQNKYNVLNKLWSNQAKYDPVTSILSEYSVQCFEYGYTLSNPNLLTLWEAQFGDFATTGQAAIDVLFSSGQSRWLRQSSLVVLLPHGLEGMGPEHSSSKVERYLQMCNDDSGVVLQPFDDKYEIRQLKEANWIIANCSVPGNYFHIIRRQFKMPFRRLLILLTPKSYLRHPEARSSFDEILEGTKFQRVIPEKGAASKAPEKVKRHILCSGRVYFEFKSQREKRKLNDVVALTRIEQIYPFPYDLISKECEKYQNAEIYWGQEEHKNQGFWDYFSERFDTLTKEKRKFGYIGRGASCCPASGIKNNHDREIKELNEAAFRGL